MDWSSVGRAVARHAPAVGLALGSPLGGAVGALVAAAFGADEKDPEAVARAVSSDPAAAVKLHEITMQHASLIATLATQAYEASLKDVQSARDTHRGHWMPAALTIALAAMVMGLVAALMTVQAPPDAKEVIYLIAGQLIGAFSTAVAYWLGSSRGSAEKQRVLEQR